MVLGLLMARAGVEVTVLEKHADFLRDFRGDTVHASTLTLLDELGLGERFARIPHRLLDRMQVQLDRAASPSPTCGGCRAPTSTSRWCRSGTCSTCWRTPPRRSRRSRCAATPRRANCCGTGTASRGSGTSTARPGPSTSCGRRSPSPATGAAPRCGRRPGCGRGRSACRWTCGGSGCRGATDDPPGGVGRFTRGHFCVLIDRGDYWQCAYLIRKGSDAALRAAGIEELRRRFATLLPWMADRVDQLRSWDDVRLLDVRLERLRRWDRDGLLLIGDAAHAMSPVGGVGINLAVQDAVAAARVLAPALASGGIVPRSVLRKVQRRRWWPTVLVQGFQRLAHRVVLGQALRNAPGAPARPAPPPSAPPPPPPANPPPPDPPARPRSGPPRHPPANHLPPPLADRPRIPPPHPRSTSAPHPPPAPQQRGRPPPPARHGRGRGRGPSARSARAAHPVPLAPDASRRG